MKRISVGDFRIHREEKKAIDEVMASGRITEGKKVYEFEKRFARFIGTKYAVALNSGTSALIAGLDALTYFEEFKVHKGTKIITSPLTYVATVNAIVQSGFQPVFVDIDPETFSITPQNIRNLLENASDVEDYSVILPVHLMGYPCQMEEINSIAKEYNLVTLEDSAQAHGTLYRGKKTGSLSLLGAFSFYVAHNIQTGELGMVVTNNEKIAKLIRRIKANGRMCDCPVCTRPQGYCPKMPEDDGEDFDPRFTHDLIGYNFKAMEFQAALGICQLKRVDTILEKRRKNIKYLNERLDRYSQILKLPKYDENISYLAYPIVIKDPQRISRKKLCLELERQGIETRPLFGCIPTQQPAYSYLRKEYEGKLPNAERMGKKGFYIGCHQYLVEEDLDTIIKTFDKILKEV